MTTTALLTAAAAAARRRSRVPQQIKSFSDDTAEETPPEAAVLPGRLSRRALLAASLLLLAFAGAAACAAAGVFTPRRGGDGTQSGGAPSPVAASFLAGATHVAFLTDLKGAPLSLAADAFGNLYVGESSGKRVAVQLADGRYVPYVVGGKKATGCALAAQLHQTALMQPCQGVRVRGRLGADGRGG